MPLPIFEKSIESRKNSMSSKFAANSSKKSAPLPERIAPFGHVEAIMLIPLSADIFWVDDPGQTANVDD